MARGFDSLPARLAGGACWVLLVLGAGTAVAQAGPVDDWYAGADGYQSAVDDAASSSSPMVVYFRATWCGYCKRFERDVLSASTVQGALGDYVTVQIDIDEEDAGELARRYSVGGVPSFFVQSSQRAAPRRMDHGMPAQSFADALRQGVGGRPAYGDQGSGDGYDDQSSDDSYDTDDDYDDSDYADQDDTDYGDQDDGDDYR